MPGRDGGLRRVLGLPSLLFYGVGLILGAGVYSVLGAAAGLAGGGLWAAFLLASVVALATGLSYAELSSMMPRVGADYVYAREAFPRWPSLAAATGLLLAATGAATAATVATAFAGYLRLFVDVPAWMAAGGLVLAAAAVNLAGVRQGALATAVMTLVEVGGLLLVIGAGAEGPGLAEALAAPELTGLLAASGLVFFAFLGFESVAVLAEEARRPERDAPRAILLAIGAATLLYVLVALAALALASPEELAASDSPLAMAASNAHPRLGTVLGAVALFATANTALAATMASSRMLYGVARGGDAPAFLARLLPRRGTPWGATLLGAAVSLALLPFGGAALLGSVASLAALGAFVVVNASMLRLRHTRPDARRPFRAPLAVRRVPLTPIAGIAGAVAFAAFLPPAAMAIGGALAAGMVLLVVLGRRAARTRTGK